MYNTSSKQLLSKKCKVDVSHRISESGSITKRIINGIYNADIAIADLTGHNPNVMYELSFRHAVKKPVIIIAEEGTKIPFDISDERVIFYRNDMSGVLELKNALIDRLNADKDKPVVVIDNPIYNFLEQYCDEQNVLNKISVEEEKNAFGVIIERLDNMERKINNQRFSSPFDEKGYFFTIKNVKEEEQRYIEDIIQRLKTLCSNVTTKKIDDGSLRIGVRFKNELQERNFEYIIMELMDNGYQIEKTKEVYLI